MILFNCVPFHNENFSLRKEFAPRGSEFFPKTAVPYGMEIPFSTLGGLPCYYSQISVIRTSIIRNYWVIRRRRKVPTFFSIIFCNKTTDYSNFDYPKNSIFRSDSSIPMKEITIKITLQDSKSKCHA